MENCCLQPRGRLPNGLFRLHVLVALLSTVSLAADSSGSEHLREGLLRGAGRARSHQRLGIVRRARTTAAPAALTTPAGLLVPLPNDTISQEYWSTVNRAIYTAGLSTPVPHTLNDQPATPEPETFKKIFQASQAVEVADTPQDQQSMNDWRLETPAPPALNEAVEGAAKVRKVGVVPYDMQLGARILYGLSPKNTQTPPPTQGYINEAFVAQCPMVMFGSTLTVRAPTCGSSMGEWADPNTNRPVLRWSGNKKGGLQFAVDSAITGNGSVAYADFNEKFTLNKYRFELLNCLEIMRYTVEEQIIKVNSVAQGAKSTTDVHDTTMTGESFFYKYIIIDPNGTAVADTGLVRMDQNEVNFTESNTEEAGIGRVIAVAQRTGDWTRDKWRSCDGMDRAWSITFPVDSQNFETVATVQDLRVASAAVLTLMAFRDESVGYDGFHHKGQGYLYWELVRTILWVFFALIVAAIFWVVFTRKAWDKKLWKFLAKVETVLLPKRPAQKRQPALNPAY